MAEKQKNTYVPRLKTMYAEKVAPELKGEFGYTSTMQIPKLRQGDRVHGRRRSQGEQEDP
jgi:hypothetical protein